MTPNMIKAVGKAAYNARFKEQHPNWVTKWEALPVYAQDVWCRVGQAAVDKFLDEAEEGKALLPKFRAFVEKVAHLKELTIVEYARYFKLRRAAWDLSLEARDLLASVDEAHWQPKEEPIDSQPETEGHI